MDRRPPRRRQVRAWRPRPSPRRAPGRAQGGDRTQGVEEHASGRSRSVDQVATQTAPVAERILRAGGIVHATTTTPEFSCTVYTHSRLWGVTRNPWNPTSRRRGLERRKRRVARRRHLDARERIRHRGLDQVAGRRVRGRRVQAAARTGAGGRRPTTSIGIATRARSRAPSPTRRCSRTSCPARIPPTSRRSGPRSGCPRCSGGIEGWHVGLSVDLGTYEVGPEVAANTRAAAASLREAGAIVAEVELPWSLEELAAAARAHYGSIFGAEIAAAVAAHGDAMNDYTLAWAEEAAIVMPRDPARSCGGSRSRRRPTRRSGSSSARTARSCARRGRCRACRPETVARTHRAPGRRPVRSAVRGLHDDARSTCFRRARCSRCRAGSAVERVADGRAGRRAYLRRRDSVPGGRGDRAPSTVAGRRGSVCRCPAKGRRRLNGRFNLRGMLPRVHIRDHTTKRCTGRDVRDDRRRS